MRYKMFRPLPFFQRLTSLVMLVSILRSAITFRMPSLIAASLLRPLFNEEAASPAAED